MRFRNFVLGVGILVVYALVLWQGMEAFYPSPEWEDFCGKDVRAPKSFPIDRQECDFNSEVEDRANSCSQVGGYFRYEYDVNGCVAGGECDECSIDFDEAQKEHSQRVFIISLIIGVLTFVVGLFILRIEPVGSALLASGIWALFWGTAINFKNFSNLTRFILLLVVLIVLIWIAWRLNKKTHFFGKLGKKKRR